MPCLPLPPPAPPIVPHSSFPSTCLDWIAAAACCVPLWLLGQFPATSLCAFYALHDLGQLPLSVYLLSLSSSCLPPLPCLEHYMHAYLRSYLPAAARRACHLVFGTLQRAAFALAHTAACTACIRAFPTLHCLPYLFLCALCLHGGRSFCVLRSLIYMPPAVGLGYCSFSLFFWLLFVCCCARCWFALPRNIPHCRSTYLALRGPVRMRLYLPLPHTLRAPPLRSSPAFLLSPLLRADRYHAMLPPYLPAVFVLLAVCYRSRTATALFCYAVCSSFAGPLRAPATCPCQVSDSILPPRSPPHPTLPPACWEEVLLCRPGCPRVCTACAWCSYYLPFCPLSCYPPVGVPRWTRPPPALPPAHAIFPCCLLPFSFLPYTGSSCLYSHLT